MQKTGTRGGARPGAGRRTLAPENKKDYIYIYAHEKERLKDLAEKNNLHIADMLREVIANYERAAY